MVQESILLEHDATLVDNQVPVFQKDYVHLKCHKLTNQPHGIISQMNGVLKF